MTGTTEAAGASRSPGDRPTATSIPARWRIVGWILLTTALVLLGLGLTLRALLMTDVDRTANDDVVQELDEFRTFASEGVDPTTAEPFDSPERLLRLYLGRQIPAANEVHLGMDSARVFAVDRSADASSPVDGEPYNLAEDGQLIEEIRTSTAPSGIADSPVGPVRWGKVSINDSDSTFVIAVFTGPDRAEVDAMIRVFAWGSVAGLALTALFGYVVAGQILAPVREVRTVAERIQENDLDGRVPVHGRDDISQLATAEGAIDFQTPRGKVPAEVARRAGLAGVPVLAIAGSLGKGAPDVHDIGIGAVTSIMAVPMPLADAVAQGRRLLVEATERSMRMILLGAAVSRRSGDRAA